MTMPNDTTTDSWYQDKRLGGLWRFAIAISALNILGHTVLGFEPAWSHPLVALAAAYGMELTIETIDALANCRKPRYLGRPRQFIEFLLSAHITGLAVSMLLYPGERFWVVAFAAAVAIASKAVLRIPVVVPNSSPSRWPRRHFMNPSNFGIAATLLLFPSVGITPPYHFTENANAFFHWGLPLLIVVSGSLVNTIFTKRVPLILAWVGGFAVQAMLRALWFGTPLVAGLMPMSGLAFVLFSFYMVTDPATTPSGRLGQVALGASVALAYGLLMMMHVVFGLFFALAIVTAVRGTLLYARGRWMMAEVEPPPLLVPGGLVTSEREQ
jgi:hypothetical protein